MNSPTDIRRSEYPALLDGLRRFFSCNPLYFASAGLLLYGINRLSSEPGLAAEQYQLMGAVCHCPRYERVFRSEFRVYAAWYRVVSEPPEGGTPNGSSARTWS